jgi:hypothetical protein
MEFQLLIPTRVNAFANAFSMFFKITVGTSLWMFTLSPTSHRVAPIRPSDSGRMVRLAETSSKSGLSVGTLGSAPVTTAADRPQIMLGLRGCLGGSPWRKARRR